MGVVYLQYRHAADCELCDCPALLFCKQLFRDNSYKYGLLMTCQKCQSRTDISQLIDYAISVLRLTYSGIKEKFNDFPICLMDYKELHKKEKMIEVRFDAEQIILSCAFDKQLMCNSSFLFLDKPECLREYIDHLNTMYTYDYIMCRWKLPGCFLSLRKTKGEVCLFFY